MNEELQHRVSSMLDYIGTVAKDADAFARGQAPLIAEEIIRLQYAHSLLGIALAVVLLVLSVWMGKKIKTAPDDGAAAGGVLMTVCFFVVGILVLGVNVHDLAKVVTAPRIVVLEYVRSIK